MYITDKCNLNCIHCLYKPNITYHMGKGEIKSNIALKLLSDLQTLGASKLSILGGEPSLYGATRRHKSLIDIINKSKDLGYEYIRMDTNGQFDEEFLRKTDLKNLDEISFSLDGYRSDINDPLRGKGTFAKCTANIAKSLDHDYNTTITTCVHRCLVEREKNGNYTLDTMIRFAESLGVTGINFHVLFKHAFPMDTWTGPADIPWYVWVEVYREVHDRIRNNRYKIPVRIPQHFVTREEFERNPEYYGYCPAKLGERVMVHPNGIMRICSGLICSQYGVARYHKDKISWDRSGTNELTDHKLNDSTPCTNQSKGMECGNLLPLCFSFKPEQDEIVWQRKLNWENRRKDSQL